MFIIIAGGGKVGGALAHDLIAADHEVVVIEKNRRKAQELADDVGSSVIPQDAAEGRWMLAAGITRADLLIAVTGDDEDNIVISQLGRALSGGRVRPIARINNPKNTETYRMLGIESIVNATDLVMSTIERDVGDASVVHLMRLRSAGLELVEFRVTADSPAVDTSLTELNLAARGGRISVILRDNEAVLPLPETLLQSGDTLIAVVQTDREEELRKLFAPEPAQPSL